MHAALNYVPNDKAAALEAPRSGLVMAVHLAVVRDRLALVAGFEDGRVEVWTAPLADAMTPTDGRKVEEKSVWKLLWTGKVHNEAGEWCWARLLLTRIVMAMAVDPAFERAFTVSADHLLCRVDLVSVSPNTLQPS